MIDNFNLFAALGESLNVFMFSWEIPGNEVSSMSFLDVVTFYSYQINYNYNQYKNFDPSTINVDPDTKQKFLTTPEIRKMGERSKSEKVPISDEKSGYM